MKQSRHSEENEDDKEKEMKIPRQEHIKVNNLEEEKTKDGPLGLDTGDNIVSSQMIKPVAAAKLVDSHDISNEDFFKDILS